MGWPERQLSDAHANSPRPATYVYPAAASRLVKPAPAGENWAHELKYDGYRIHARLVSGEARLLTRTGLDWPDRYEATAKAVCAPAAKPAYLDGELSIVRSDGTAAFSQMQAATEGRTTNLVPLRL
jgi:ATP-dependent DNA ligase